jgi:hypothetical protein
MCAVFLQTIDFCSSHNFIPEENRALITSRSKKFKFEAKLAIDLASFLDSGSACLFKFFHFVDCVPSSHLHHHHHAKVYVYSEAAGSTARTVCYFSHLCACMHIHTHTHTYTFGNCDKTLFFLPV